MTGPAVALPVDALLLLGPTGAGKSPLGDALARGGFLGRKAHHLDFGAELRSAAGPLSSAFTCHEIDFIRGVLERGLLLENEHFSLAEKIVLRFLERMAFSSGDLLVLNGIPRHTGQANDVARIASVRAVVVLECSADDVLCRIEGNVGGDRAGREDDETPRIAKKLAIFTERTAPLLSWYEQAGCRIYRLQVNGTTTSDEAGRELSALAAADPPIALIAEPPQR